MTERHLTSAELRAKADAVTAKILAKRPVPGAQAAAPASQRPTASLPDLEPIAESSVSPDLESWWLPDPVRDWVDAVAAFYGVPKTMPIAGAMCAAATVLQGKVSVEMVPGILQPLTLWWAVMARTGGRKSSVMKLAKAPIIAMQAAESARLKPDIIDRANERARLEAQISRMRRATKAHAYTEGSQEHRQQLRELEAELTACEVPIPFHWVYDNINPAMLPQVLERNLESEDQCARIAIWGEEGTFFANVLGRHSGTPMAETLNQGYSGSSLDSTRKIDGTRQLIDIHVPETFVSMCVFMQPHYRERLRNQELADNGFLGRLLLSEVGVGARPKRGQVQPPSPEVLKGYADWLWRLAAIPAGTVYRLSDAAQALLDAHVEEVDQHAMADGEGQGWALRSPERIARLLAICALGDVAHVAHVAHVAPEPRGRHEDIKAKYLISSLYSAYLREAQAQEPAPPAPRRDAGDMWARWATSGIQVGEVVTSRQLRRLKKRWSRERVLEAAHELIAMGILDQEQSPVRSGSVILKEVFRVVGTLAPTPALRLVPQPEEPPPDPELDDDPPPASEYLGGDEFEGTEP